jgi:hypothetical protein
LEVDVGGINIGRVVLGGLLAGVVINLGETILNLVVVAQEIETCRLSAARRLLGLLSSPFCWVLLQSGFTRLLGRALARALEQQYAQACLFGFSPICTVESRRH